MKTLRLKTGEKIAIDVSTTFKVMQQLTTGSELIMANEIIFWRENFQSIIPMSK